MVDSVRFSRPSPRHCVVVDPSVQHSSLHVFLYVDNVENRCDLVCNSAMAIEL